MCEAALCQCIHIPCIKVGDTIHILFTACNFKTKSMKRKKKHYVKFCQKINFQKSSIIFEPGHKYQAFWEDSMPAYGHMAAQTLI